MQHFLLDYGLYENTAQFQLINTRACMHARVYIYIYDAYHTLVHAHHKTEGESYTCYLLPAGK